MRIFKEHLDKYVDDMVSDLQGLLRIRSVKEVPLTGKPFGEESAKALEYTLNIGKKLGFYVENFDNYAGHIDYGDGTEIAGILAHVDVVPEGELNNWNYDPYGAQIDDGVIYSRGTLDDKGPLMACLYAMKMIKDLNLDVSKKIRLIAGANEEAGCACMEYYFNTLKIHKPDISFTPDSEFPVTIAEKGMLKGYFRAKDVLSTFIGGEAGNMVADSAQVSLPGKYLDAVKAVVAVDKEGGCFDISENGENFILKARGKSAHASTPESGKNAISALLCLLAKIDLDDTGLKKMADFFAGYIKNEYNGESLGISHSDDVSGVLTINFGTAYIEDSDLIITIDSRLPVTTDIDRVEKQLKKMAEESGIEYIRRKIVPPVYVPKDSFLVKSLMEAYRNVTGDVTSDATYTGGGTYAKFLDNCVSYGPLLPNMENTLHQPNEKVSVEELKTMLEIYAEAIYMISK